MIHLTKQTTKEVQNIQLNRMACVNSPFIKGRLADKEEFAQLMETKLQHCCKKCQSIYRGLK